MVVERERLRMTFVSASYWDLVGLFSKQEASSTKFNANLVFVGKRRLAIGKDFDDSGKLNSDEVRLLSGEDARRLVESYGAAADWKVSKVEERPYTDRPSPPFTTSTLQQEAGRKLRFSARQTMQIAQRLYENGHISYMRTDSTALSEQAVRNARGLI